MQFKFTNLYIWFKLNIPVSAFTPKNCVHAIMCNKIKIKLLLSNFQCVFSTQLMGFNLSIHCTYIWCDNKNKGYHGSLMRQLFIYNGLLQIL